MAEFDNPQSRNEAILQNMLGAENSLLEPVSRIETLLMQLHGSSKSAVPMPSEVGTYVLQVTVVDEELNYEWVMLDSEGD